MDRHVVSGDGQVLLDLGVGDGFYVPSYLERGFKVVGLDNNSQSSKELNGRLADRNNLSLLVGDAKSVPFKDSSVDVVFMCQLLEHVNEPTMVLKEAFRVLKPGGHLFVDVPWWHEMFRPLSTYLLRQLQQFKARRRAPLLFRLFFKTRAGRVQRRALTNLPVRLIHLFPTFRGIEPEPFIERYLRGEVAEGNLHLHFYLASEWRRLVEEAGFKVDVVSGAWLAPPPLNRISFFNRLFGRLEERLGDAWLARVSQILILKAVKPEPVR